jgi:hypothetical protein
LDDLGVLELAAGEVDVEGEGLVTVGMGVLPGGGLLAGFAQDPGAEGSDQP